MWDLGPAAAHTAPTFQTPRAQRNRRLRHGMRTPPAVHSRLQTDNAQLKRLGHRLTYRRCGQSPHPRRQHSILAPSGFPLWVSDAEPGSVHDLTAARIHALPALYRAAAAGLPTLADPGHDGAGIGINIPVKQPPGGPRRPRPRYQHPHPQRPATIASLPGRTRVRPAHRPLACPAAHHRQPRQNRRHRPRSPGPDPFRARLHHMNFAEITSVIGTHTVLQGRYSVTECWPGCPCSTTSLARLAVINPLRIAIAGELTGRHRSVVGLKNTTPRRVSGRKGAGTLRACAAQAGVPRQTLTIRVA